MYVILKRSSVINVYDNGETWSRDHAFVSFEELIIAENYNWKQKYKDKEGKWIESSKVNKKIVIIKSKCWLANMKQATILPM